MNYIKAIFLCAAALLLLSTCDKTPPDPPCPGHTDTTILPPPTQCGANTFGCLVNGEVWVPEIDHFTPNTEKVHAEYGKEYFVVMGARILDKDSVFEAVKVALRKDITSPGVFRIAGYSIDKTYGQVIYYYSNNEFETNAVNSGELEITKLDRENFIISGTFWFTAVNNQGDTIRLTDGRFDVRE